MCRNATTALAAVLFFGTTSFGWADGNDQNQHSFAQSPAAIASSAGSGANESAMPFTRRGKPSLAASQRASARAGTVGRTTAWIKLTEPGGKAIHVNLEHVTSVRSDTQIPGAKAQLDLTSGKFQGVQEDIEQVMRLISAPSVGGNDDTPSPRLPSELTCHLPKAPPWS
jgi:hypothetical protein